MTSYAFIGHNKLFYGDMSHVMYYETITSWLRNIEIIASSWRYKYVDSYCMNHTKCVIKSRKNCLPWFSVKNQFNQLVRQLNRGWKPSGWKKQVRFSRKTYRIHLYWTTRWRKLSISKKFPQIWPSWDHQFSNRSMRHFSVSKIEKFGIVGKRRFSSFI